MPVRFAAGIECSTTMDATHRAALILMDSHGIVTGAAQNGLGVIFVRLPALCRMISESFMAKIASVIALAAFKKDGDDIERAAVMIAARGVIYVNFTDAF